MKKRIFTSEMLHDLTQIGDKDFSKKWHISLPAIVRARKEHKIKAFNNQHGLKEHKSIEGVEHKYCPRDGGHWSPIPEFGKANNRYDGLRGICKYHEALRGRELYIITNKNEKTKIWRQTDSGRQSLRTTWRKSKAKKLDAYVLWESEHEQSAYEYFGGRCAYCGKSVEFLRVEFDHFIPITKGGKTHPNNMLPCCKKCNHGVGGKFNKDPLEWLWEKFGELNGNMIYLVCQTALAQLGETK